MDQRKIDPRPDWAAGEHVADNWQEPRERKRNQDYATSNLLPVVSKNNFLQTQCLSTTPKVKELVKERNIKLAGSSQAPDYLSGSWVKRYLYLLELLWWEVWYGSYLYWLFHNKGRLFVFWATSKISIHLIVYLWFFIQFIKKHLSKVLLHIIMQIEL